MEPKIKRAVNNFYYGHIEDGEYIPDYLRSTSESNYDSNGLLICHIFQSYNEDGKIDNELKITRRQESDLYIYETFNSEGKIIDYEKVNTKGYLLESKSRCGQLCTWEYDNNGNMVHHKSTGPDLLENFEVNYVYNEHNRLIKSIHLNVEPTTALYVYSKDINGNLVMTQHNDINQCRESDVHYKESNSLLEIKEELIEDQANTVLRFFDKEQNEVCCISWNNDNEIRTYHMTYSKYDPYGNWVIRVTPPRIGSYFPDECSIEIRTLEYFNDILDYRGEFTEFDSF